MCFWSDTKCSAIGHKAQSPFDVLRAKAHQAKRKTGPQLLNSNDGKRSVPFKARELKVNSTEIPCMYEYY